MGSRMMADRESGVIAIRQKDRTNGWSWPLHPFQVIAWFFVVGIPLVYYGILASHLPHDVLIPGCVLPGICLFFHIIFHLACLTVNPADPNVKLKKVEKAAEFDRALHKHVIENYHCYICQVEVSKKSKHCANCNKCISDFDHHCLWLNNCIGGQNYRMFLGCVSSALASVVFIMAFCLYLCIVYFIDRDRLVKDRWWSIVREMNDKTFLAVDIVIIVLLFVAFLLLGHLMCFHIVLISKGMSTYDFIVQSRQTVAEAAESNPSISMTSPKKLKSYKVCKPRSLFGRTSMQISASPRPNFEGSTCSRVLTNVFELNKVAAQEITVQCERSSAEMKTKHVQDCRIEIDDSS
ncbi:palmitoyltransferase ZDHHC11-like isoform X2 [Xenia sp. Carnegie-2017]|uniref:palmitoyltransferase ZDHHC11-like isoform X2 n=1 Tax=Xenia sp. Carnegie-2017 TaxID=2897299 RepID=UPI001F037AA8|nr:palmitoyltransferase ZDHHC11-like isoform X2 [Xenia sp. Carnegie-2017]